MAYVRVCFTSSVSTDVVVASNRFPKMSSDHFCRKQVFRNFEAVLDNKTAENNEFLADEIPSPSFT